MSTILYASFIQTTDTSTLSDREMDLITGKCSCNEYEWQVCRKYGDLECTTGSNCNSSENNYTDNWIPKTVDYVLPPNGKTSYFSGYVDCYQPYSVNNDGTQDDAECEDVSHVIDPDYWSGWYYYCKSDSWTVGLTCNKCEWNEPISEMVDFAGFNCH